jgi:hypothetical protein
VAGATNCAAENIGIWQKCQSVTKKQAVTCHILLPCHPNRSYGFFPILIHILKFELALRRVIYKSQKDDTIRERNLPK